MALKMYLDPNFSLGLREKSFSFPKSAKTVRPTLKQFEANVKSRPHNEYF